MQLAYSRPHSLDNCVASALRDAAASVQTTERDDSSHYDLWRADVAIRIYCAAVAAVIQSPLLRLLRLGALNAVRVHLHAVAWRIINLRLRMEATPSVGCKGIRLKLQLFR